MKIQKNISLKKYNTFGIDVNAKYFCEITSINDLSEALQLKEYPEIFVISGGSNMLLTKDINALVLHINIKGIQIISETDQNVIIKVMAGENWHNFVLWALEHNFGGIENMSFIPGNVGTSPIQNIGAYGVELKDVFYSCEAIDINNQTIRVFSKFDCNFGYRESFFKREGKGKYIITSVNIKLTKNNHKLNTSYGTIESELTKNNITKPSIKDVSEAVIAIRKSKLPGPKEIGNSGSFFKNPILNYKEFNVFITKNIDAPYYKMSEDEYKIPAGWLIEQCGFKGKRFGDAGVHEKQALVLVNYGDASGKDIIHLAQKIINEVDTKFEITIFPEVNII